MSDKILKSGTQNLCAAFVCIGKQCYNDGKHRTGITTQEEKQMKQVKYQDHLRHSFIRYVCIILAVVLFLYVVSFTLNLYTAVIRKNEKNNARLAADFSAQYNAYTAEIELLSSSRELQTVLLENSAKNRSAANQLLYDFSNIQTFRSYFVLMNAEKEVIGSNFNESNQTIFSESIFTESAISRLNKFPSEVQCFICSAPVSSAQACCYSFCGTLINGDGAIAGYLFFNLRQESFQAYAHTMSEDILMTDSYDNIIYTTLDQEADPQGKSPSGKLSLGIEQNGIIKYNNTNTYFYVQVRTMRPAGVHFYTLTSLETQVQMLWHGLILFLGLILILSMIVVVMTRTFSQTNVREIGELTTAVDELGRGNMDYQLSPRISKEFQDLYDSFRQMTVRLRDLMQHNVELQERRRQMEVKQLEEQFNPHFVFNVMETVRYQISEDPEIASEMLTSFANLMRYSINNGQPKVSLETDIQYINDFLLLQKIRYNNCLNYEFDIPDELLDCQIPKLLLQPVIENSIKHGYLQGKVLKIIVEARREGERLYFTVRDNGAGISPDRLHAINDTLAGGPDHQSVKHIGLYNIQKILSLLYGSEYGIRIESTLGQGTCVILTMPYEMEE